jgi:hypothetical protein
MAKKTEKKTEKSKKSEGKTKAELALEAGRNRGYSSAIWLIVEQFFKDDPYWALEDLASTLWGFCRDAGINIQIEYTGIRDKISKAAKESKDNDD